MPARTIIYLGMDVRKDSITIAVLPADAKVTTRLEKLPNDPRPIYPSSEASRHRTCSN